MDVTLLRYRHACTLCMQCGEAVTVSIAASFLTKTAAIESFTQQMPGWVANSATTTFQSSWTFWFEKNTWCRGCTSQIVPAVNIATTLRQLSAILILYNMQLYIVAQECMCALQCQYDVQICSCPWSSSIANVSVYAACECCNHCWGNDATVVVTTVLAVSPSCCCQGWARKQ